MRQNSTGPSSSSCPILHSSQVPRIISNHRSGCAGILICRERGRTSKTNRTCVRVYKEALRSRLASWRRAPQSGFCRVYRNAQYLSRFISGALLHNRAQKHPAERRRKFLDVRPEDFQNFLAAQNLLGCQAFGDQSFRQRRFVFPVCVDARGGQKTRGHTAAAHESRINYDAC